MIQPFRTLRAVLLYSVSLVGLAVTCSLDPTRVGSLPPDILAGALRALEAVNPELSTPLESALTDVSLDNVSLLLSNLIKESMSAAIQLKSLLCQAHAALKSALMRQTLSPDFPTQYSSIILSIANAVRSLLQALETTCHLRKKIHRLARSPRRAPPMVRFSTRPTHHHHLTTGVTCCTSSARLTTNRFAHTVT